MSAYAELDEVVTMTSLRMYSPNCIIASPTLRGSVPPLTEYWIYCRRISLLLFDHMLDLDLRFHLMRKTGEVSKIIDRGTDAMQAKLSTRDTALQ